MFLQLPVIKANGGIKIAKRKLSRKYQVVYQKRILCLILKLKHLAIVFVSLNLDAWIKLCAAMSFLLVKRQTMFALAACFASTAKISRKNELSILYIVFAVDSDTSDWLQQNVCFEFCKFSLGVTYSNFRHFWLCKSPSLQWVRSCDWQTSIVLKWTKLGS